VPSLHTASGSTELSELRVSVLTLSSLDGHSSTGTPRPLMLVTNGPFGAELLA
jgi:hypothetical protein